MKGSGGKEGGAEGRSLYFLLNLDKFSIDSEIRRRVYLIHFSVFVAVFFLVSMSVIVFIEGHKALGYMNLICACFVLLILLYLHVSKNVGVTVFISTLAAGSFFFILLLHGGVGNNAFVWYYTFPLYSVFVLGPKRGAAVSFLLGAAAAAYFSVDSHFPNLAQYRLDFKFRFIPSYMIVVLFSYLADNFREISQRKLHHAYETLDHKVQERTSELWAKNIALEVASSTDALTGIKNRMKLDEILHYEINMSKRYKRGLCIILIDIDNFKNINDTFGHIAGDDVLIKFADTLKSHVRNTDTLGRWGGEEFLIICPEMDRDNSLAMADKLRHLISITEFSIAGHLTASFGVTCYRDGDNINSIVKRADDALYMAKSRRNTCCDCSMLDVQK